jgi:hypothetical protein
VHERNLLSQLDERVCHVQEELETLSKILGIIIFGQTFLKVPNVP